MKKVTNSLLLILFPKINSPKGQLDFRDKVQGLIRGILTSGIAVAVQSWESGKLTLDWNAITIAGIMGGLAYLGFAGFNGKKV